MDNALNKIGQAYIGESAMAEYDAWVTELGELLTKDGWQVYAKGIYTIYFNNDESTCSIQIFNNRGIIKVNLSTVGIEVTKDIKIYADNDDTKDVQKIIYKFFNDSLQKSIKIMKDEQKSLNERVAVLEEKIKNSSNLKGLLA